MPAKPAAADTEAAGLLHRRIVFGHAREIYGAGRKRRGIGFPHKAPGHQQSSGEAKRKHKHSHVHVSLNPDVLCKGKTQAENRLNKARE
jgi:hypothetical protein